MILQRFSCFFVSKSVITLDYIEDKQSCGIIKLQKRFVEENYERGFKKIFHSVMMKQR